MVRTKRQMNEQLPYQEKGLKRKLKLFKFNNNGSESSTSTTVWDKETEEKVVQLFGIQRSKMLLEQVIT